MRLESAGSMTNMNTVENHTVDLVLNKHVKETMQKDKQINKDDIVDMVNSTNKELKAYDRKLEFSVHEKTKDIMVKVIDTTDNTVVKEIPSEKILDMVAHMCELAGLFVDEIR